MADRRTLEVYAARAADYARTFGSERPDRTLTEFIGALPKGARVLDLGCGPGQSAAFMRKAGLDVEAWDASPEMAALAADRHGLAVTIADFADLDADAAYDGIYANFSLLHAPRMDMPGLLGRISRALRPGGLLELGLKTGAGEGRDRLGRFYTYYTPDELAALLTAAGLTVTSSREGREKGLAGPVEPFVILFARKQGPA